MGLVTDYMAGPVARRHTFLLAALVTLLVVCRQGVGLPTVMVAVVLYVVAVTLVVRAEYVTWVSCAAPPWTPRYAVLLTLLGTGVAVVAAGFLLPVDGIGWLVFPGAVAAYLSVGLLLTRLRSRGRPETQLRVGVGAVALTVGGAGLGLTLLAVSVALPVGLLLLAAGLAAAPTGVSVLAERAVRRLAGHSGRRFTLALAGGGLVVAAAGAAMAQVGSVWMLLTLVALAGLMIAIASGTLADAFAVLGVMALMGVTPMHEPVPDSLRPDEGDRKVLVAFGDSYMSGEGAEVYYEGTDEGGVNHCRRSPTAWAALAGERGDFDGLAFLACSGARTRNVREGGAVQLGEQGTQLEQYAALQRHSSFTPGLVVISIGGNDAGFSTVGTTCLAPGSCDHPDVRRTFLDSLDQVERSLVRAFAQMRRQFPTTPVVVTAYPSPVHRGPGGRVCDDLALSRGDVDFIDRFLGALNERVRTAAEANGFHFLAEMEQAMADAHLQLCDPANGARPGLNFVGLRSVSGLAEQRFNPMNWIHNSFHPNERGHAAMLRTFEQWLAAHPDLAAPGRGEAPPGAGLAVMPASGGGAAEGSAVGSDVGPATSPTSAVGVSGCDLVGADATLPSCRAEADRWALSQLARSVLWPWGWLVGAMALGSWLLAVAFFASRRMEQ